MCGTEEGYKPFYCNNYDILMSLKQVIEITEYCKVSGKRVLTCQCINSEVSKVAASPRVICLYDVKELRPRISK